MVRAGHGQELVGGQSGGEGSGGSGEERGRCARERVRVCARVCVCLAVHSDGGSAAAGVW